MAVTEERQRAPAMIEGIGRGSGTAPVVARLAGGRIAARRIGRQPRRGRGAEQSDSGIADASAGSDTSRLIRSFLETWTASMGVHHRPGAA